jgi:hypothetical protein
MDRLDTTADLIGANRRFLISKTNKPAGNKVRASCNLAWLIEQLEQRTLRT